MNYDIADYADLVEAHQEAIPDEPEQSPWSEMELPAIFAYLVSQGETPEVAADITDGIMIERNGNGNNGRAA